MTKEIKLTNSDLVALVDDEDYEELNRYEWSINKAGYIFRYQYIGRIGPEVKYKKKHILMHRAIMNMDDYKSNESMQVDHVNRIRHDNRKLNLRVCTRNENSRNRTKTIVETTSIYKGVYRKEDKCTGKGFWIACIAYENDRYTLKYGHDQVDLAMTYDRAAIFLHKEFASLNFPEYDYSKEMIGYKLPNYKDETTSKFRGVSWCESRSLWKSEIQIFGKYKIIGRFETEYMALNAYEQVCKFYGLTDRMNFPNKEPDLIIDVEKFDKRNYQKTSAYVGVRYRSKVNKFNPYVVIDGKEKSLGHHDDELFSARLREKYVIENSLQNKNKLNFDGEY